MGHCLGFFAHKPGADTDEVKRAFKACRSGVPIDWPACKEVQRFSQALQDKFPMDSVAADGEALWSGDFTQSDGYLVIEMVFAKTEEVGAHIWHLLQHHHLVVYDPQADKAYMGMDELPRTNARKAWWQFWL